jgi:hypothetical protein
MPEISAALRSGVRSRAAGRCEYCLVPEELTLVPHEVDHIIATKHGGGTASDNLALCCTLCNKYKGSGFASIDPVSGEMQCLFHPRRDQWHEHFPVARCYGNTTHGDRSSDIAIVSVESHGACQGTEIDVAGGSGFLNSTSSPARACAASARRADHSAPAKITIAATNPHKIIVTV